MVLQEGGFGDGVKFREGEFGSELLEHEVSVLEGEYGVFGDDHVGFAEAGDGKGTLVDQLGLAVFAAVLHGNDDLARAGHEVHGAPTPSCLPLGMIQLAMFPC